MINVPIAINTQDAPARSIHPALESVVPKRNQTVVKAGACIKYSEYEYLPANFKDRLENRLVNFESLYLHESTINTAPQVMTILERAISNEYPKPAKYQGINITKIPKSASGTPVMYFLVGKKWIAVPVKNTGNQEARSKLNSTAMKMTHAKKHNEAKNFLYEEVKRTVTKANMAIENKISYLIDHKLEFIQSVPSITSKFLINEVISNCTA
jgi:hypothetical protein